MRKQRIERKKDTVRMVRRAPNQPTLCIAAAGGGGRGRAEHVTKLQPWTFCIVVGHCWLAQRLIVPSARKGASASSLLACSYSTRTRSRVCRAQESWYSFSGQHSSSLNINTREQRIENCDIRTGFSLNLTLEGFRANLYVEI